MKAATVSVQSQPSHPSIAAFCLRGALAALVTSVGVCELRLLKLEGASKGKIKKRENLRGSGGANPSPSRPR